MRRHDHVEDERIVVPVRVLVGSNVATGIFHLERKLSVGLTLLDVRPGVLVWLIFEIGDVGDRDFRASTNLYTREQELTLRWYSRDQDFVKGAIGHRRVGGINRIGEAEVCGRKG